MAIASPDSELDICNMALGRIGAKTVTSAQITADTEPRAIQCNLHYAQTRDALLRSHWWRFAGARIDLAVVTNGDFANWTDDDPDDWTVTDDAVATDEVSEVGSGEGHDGTGTKKCNIYSAADGTGVQIAQTISTVVGLDYKFSININKITAGELAVENLPEPTDGDTDWDSTGTKTVTFTADATSFSLVIKGYTAAATNITFDNISVVVVPAFEWTYGYTLPSDFLAFRSIWEDNNTIRENTVYSYALEGNLLLFNETGAKIRYTKQITTVTDFDPLFLEVFVLQLALKIVYPIAGVGSAGRALAAEIKHELYGSPRQPGLMSKVRALDRYERERIGRSERPLWNNARYSLSGRRDDKLGSA